MGLVRAAARLYLSGVHMFATALASSLNWHSTGCTRRQSFLYGAYFTGGGYTVPGSWWASLHWLRPFTFSDGTKYHAGTLACTSISRPASISRVPSSIPRVSLNPPPSIRSRAENSLRQAHLECSTPVTVLSSPHQIGTSLPLLTPCLAPLCTFFYARVNVVTSTSSSMRTSTTPFAGSVITPVG